MALRGQVGASTGEIDADSVRDEKAVTHEAKVEAVTPELSGAPRKLSGSPVPLVDVKAISVDESPEAEWKKYVASVGEAKDRVVENQLAYTGLLLECDTLKRKLDSLLSQLPALEEAQAASVDAWEHLVHEGREVVAEDDQEAAKISHAMDASSLIEAERIFKLNKPRWDFLEEQAKAVNSARNLAVEMRRTTVGADEKNSSAASLEVATPLDEPVPTAPSSGYRAAFWRAVSKPFARAAGTVATSVNHSSASTQSPAKR